jgi:cellobiose-specific phosphotransferase system component IIA
MSTDGVPQKKASVAPDIQIECSTLLTYDQDAFMSNMSHKQMLINLLAQHLRDAKFQTRQSQGDANTDVAAAAAVEIAGQGSPVVVYAEDTDILALLLYHWQPSMSPVFLKSDGKAKTPGKCIDIGILQNRIGLDACRQILVLHAFGGCDTTSAIFMHGKGKLFMQVSQNKQMSEFVRVMQHPNSAKVQVCRAGVALMVAVYGGKSADTDKLGHMRYAAYSKMIASRAGSFVADRLPPTEDAAELHAMRVHFQAVVWGTFGRTTLLPTDWGWHLKGSSLFPIPMQQQPGPPELMKVIFCNCKSDKPCSSQLCTCRKNNLKCIVACGHCHGVDCANADTLIADDHDSDSESDREDGNAGCLPDFLSGDDLDFVDEEVVDFALDFIFDHDAAGEASCMLVDEEIVD